MEDTTEDHKSPILELFEHDTVLPPIVMISTLKYSHATCTMF